MNWLVKRIAKRHIHQAFYLGTTFGAVCASIQDEDQDPEPLNITRLAEAGANSYMVEIGVSKPTPSQTNAIHDLEGRTPAEIAADRVDRQRAILLDVMVILLFACLVWAIVWVTAWVGSL